MPLLKVKPTSPGRRALVKVVTPELHKGDPHWALTRSQIRASWRNTHGRITTRHQGGGHKHHLRIIDWRRNKDAIPAKVQRLEDDPTRSAHLALLLYAAGERRYVIAAKGVQAGAQLMSGANAPIKAGNALPLRNIPVGTIVHCVEMLPGKGAQLARSARAGVGARPRSCACALGRSARCTSTAAPPSARPATPSTTWNRSARPAACAGAACGRRCAAWR